MYWNVCYHKEKLTHQENLQLVSDRADLYK